MTLLLIALVIAVPTQSFGKEMSTSSKKQKPNERYLTMSQAELESEWTRFNIRYQECKKIIAEKGDTASPQDFSKVTYSRKQIGEQLKARFNVTKE